MMTALFLNDSYKLNTAQILAMKNLSLILNTMKIKIITIHGYANNNTGVNNLSLAANRGHELERYLIANHVKAAINVIAVAVNPLTETPSQKISMRKADLWVEAFVG